MIVVGLSPVHAVEAVNVRTDARAIDLTDAAERHRTEADRLLVSAAPGPDGIIRRMDVRAREGNTNWAVFALANPGDEQIERLIVVPHYRMVGSGVFWPDLGRSRVASITSSGERPDRQDSATADIFRITLDPGSVMTYVLEMRGDKLNQLYLWEPEAYKDKVNSITLYHGIVIGIAGLLALFLTILFVVKGSIMFPAAAALGWAVLVYIGIDFGFWGKVFALSPDSEQIWRASGEAILAATLVVFLFAYLNLNRWHVRYAHITLAWLAFLAALVALALYEPPVASGIARVSLVAVAVLGFGLVVYLSFHGFDRAVLLIPTWFLLVVWVFAAALAVMAVITNDIVGPALLGGLVLIVMLIGFTVMQHAFAGGGATTGVVSDVERRALALAGSGDLIWDWDVSSDKVFTSPETEHLLGLKRGTLEGPAAKWLEVLHPLDQDRFRASLDSVLDQRRGRLVQDFRLRTPDGHFMWFSLKARPVVGSDGEVSRVVGTLTDVTEIKNAEERMLHDSVHDNLTGLPNRKLFIDRLGAVANFAKSMPSLRPTLMVIDLDRFKQVNDSVGIAVGDSILLTLARRLTRILKPQDTLARLAGDQFGLILLSEQDPARITAFAETIRKTIRAPIAFNDREIFLTASIGLALSDPQTQITDEIIKDAELAMYHSKRIGGDRIDVYKPAMRSRKQDRLTLESELRRAIERQEISLLYQPIVRLEDRAVAGFEALARWDHPKLGRMSPIEFITIAEEIGAIVDLGTLVLDQAARQLSVWQRAMRAREPIFMSVNVSSRQLLRHDLIHDIRTVLSRWSVARGTLKIELTESLVMENPEHAAQMLTRIRELGTGLSLDDFGTGHSSLAYLQRFPFDTIKIDQSFVRTTSRGTRPVILKSIIALAHDLGMDVVAEGAETDSDAVELYQLGCEYAQGFAFGEPMDADAAIRLLTEERLEAAS